MCPTTLRSAFAYEAGQFCTFRVRIDDRVLLRCYSMSSSPAVDAELTVTVKRTPGGVVSNWMNDELTEGDTLEATRPAGVFRLGPSPGDLVAFSAGSGITPVLSLVKTALATTTRRVRLLYANQHRDAVIFASQLEALGRHYGERLSVSHHLDVDQGLVQAETVGDFADLADDPEFYVCGPGPFMDLVEQSLHARGVVPGAHPHRAVHTRRIDGRRRALGLAWDEASARGGDTGHGGTGRPNEHCRPSSGYDDPADSPSDGPVSPVLLRGRELRHLHGQAGGRDGGHARQQRPHRRRGGAWLDTYLSGCADKPVGACRVRL